MAEENWSELVNNILHGIGKEAELETNTNGGSQSKAVGAMHLVDPMFLINYICDDVTSSVARFMLGMHREHLIEALEYLPIGTTKYDLLIILSRILQEGAEKYGVNNWRLIPQEEHINHALLHYLAYLVDDDQDEHLAHCACRLMFAYATEKSEGFDYTRHKSQLEPRPKDV